MKTHFSFIVYTRILLGCIKYKFYDVTRNVRITMKNFFRNIHSFWSLTFPCQLVIGNSMKTTELLVADPSGTKMAHHDETNSNKRAKISFI